MKNLPRLIRGDTFQYTVFFAPLPPWEGVRLSELKSQIRDEQDQLIADVVITEGNTLGEFICTVEDTSNFPTGKILVTDIQRTREGTPPKISSTDPFQFVVAKDVTR